MDLNRSRDLGYRALERHEREQALASPRELSDGPGRGDPSATDADPSSAPGARQRSASPTAVLTTPSARAMLQ